MCGINGIVFKQSLAPTRDYKADLNIMNTLIKHRGPDDEGSYASGNVLMGMRRLSIIDLSTGHQPIFNDSKSLCIVFNGEIYNYRILRENLVAKGVTFNTHSDTEVVLKMYEQYGPECVSQLNGMFAFSIHDVVNKKVFIARDRFGEKPLYYATTDQEFLWASELKSITVTHPKLKQISHRGLNTYLGLSYIPAPLTIYDEVYKLKAGHHLTVDINTLAIKIEKYWDIKLDATKDKTSVSYETAMADIKDIMVSSVEQKMIADVPLGVFLSGGVDSSIVAALMAKVSNRKIKTFSVGYRNKRYDESERAAIVASHIGSDHHLFMLEYDDLLQMMDKIILNYDEPFADPSSLPTYFLAAKTVEHVKVALTGDGGDEVFGGYNKYLIHTYGKMYKSLVPNFVSNNILKPILNSPIWGTMDSRSTIGRLNKMLDSVSDNVTDSHLNIIALGFKQHNLERLLKSENLGDFKKTIRKVIEIPQETDGDVLKVARYIDKNTSLEGDMLVKVDRASMLCSLECRAPFLDHRLMEYTNTLPDKYLIKGNNKKKILKDTFSDLLPPEFFNSPKSGFEIPLAYWFRHELKSELVSVLSLSNLQKHALFNNEYVLELINEHINGSRDHSNKLWTLFCFQKWYNKELEG